MESQPIPYSALDPEAAVPQRTLGQAGSSTYGLREIRASRAMRPTLAWGSSRVTGKPIGQLRAMTPLARDGPKLRPEILPLARIPGETLDLGSLVPVVLSGPHAALPRF